MHSLDNDAMSSLVEKCTRAIRDSKGTLEGRNHENWKNIKSTFTSKKKLVQFLFLKEQRWKWQVAEQHKATQGSTRAQMSSILDLSSTQMFKCLDEVVISNGFVLRQPLFASGRSVVFSLLYRFVVTHTLSDSILRPLISWAFSVDHDFAHPARQVNKWGKSGKDLTI